MLAAGCGSDDGGGSGGATDGDGSGGGSGGTPDTEPSGDTSQVTVDGIVTFDFVPSRNGELVYAETEERPARAVTVEARADGSVVASATTDATGAFELELPANRAVTLRVRAEMDRTGALAWDVRVVDNTDADALYVLEGTEFDTGETDSTRNLHAASGWTGTGYGAPRAAAPFAILDTIYDAMQFVLDTEPDLTFPSLVVHWSPANRPAEGNLADGDIGSSFYRRGVLSEGTIFREIYVLGAANNDPDEYDRHVIVHEWGHYFESEFSRSDSIGGPHTFGDRLDMRVAFGEGFGNAFSGMVTGESVYSDAGGDQQSRGFHFDIEGRTGGNPAPGWYSEQSVHEILWDIYDDTADESGHDQLALGFGPIHTVLTGPQRTTPALTSVFSFLAELKRERPDRVAAIERLTEANAIDPVQDAFGSEETNDAGASHDNILPVYREGLAVNGGPVANVCSTDEFTSSFTDARNKLGSRRFLRFDVEAGGSHRITVTTTKKPDDADSADPDFRVFRRGFFGESTDPPDEWSAACMDADSEPETCVEEGMFQLPEGAYVLEVYEWTNTNSTDDEYPPIGPTCFDVEVARQ